MGLRTASVRRPYAEVMAPALTEATQSQNFKLPPKPASPINGFETTSKYLSSPTHQKTYCSNKTREFENTEKNQHGAPPASNDTTTTTQFINEINEAAGDTCDSNIIMSDSSTLMGDQTTDNMGLEKAELVDSLTKIQNDNNKTNDVDQILNNLTSNLQPGDIDLGQNVDDIMQVIKSIENDNEPSNALIDGNDEIPMQLPTNYAIEKLFNDVEMMNMSVEDQTELESKDLIADLKMKQAKIERRLDFMLRKVRKLQLRHMGQHVSGEIAGVYEYIHRSLKRLKDQGSSVAGGGGGLHDNSIGILPTTTSTASTTDDKSLQEKAKPMSYGSTKAMLKKLEMTAILQANTASRQKQLSRYFGSGSYEPTNFRCNVPGVLNIPPWSKDNKSELQKVAGLLRSEISMVQEDVDSEATESSSGGESCDEMQTYNNPHQQYLSIQKRALWKYMTSRAAIAARWTWLQAQIADLEYRIRQHTDLQRQLRLTKGEVKLGGVSPPSPSLLPDYGDIPSSPTAVVNGYRGQISHSSPISTKLPPLSTDDTNNVNNVDVTTTPTIANGAHVEYQCARTRPLVNFKKRRLVQINGLHAISKKANRPSSVRCGCDQSIVQCAVCTGRTDPTHPRDPSDALSKSERIALVDSGFHPVISLPEDISCGIHCDAIMKTSEWQQRSIRMKSLKVMKGDRSDKSMLERSKKLEHRKKYGRILKPNTAATLSTKIKNKIRGRKMNRHAAAFRLHNRKRNTAKVAIAQLQALAAEGGVDEEVESIGNNSNIASNSAAPSPCSSPLLHMQAISGYNRRNRANSYDIDNIVIPYSVAAATRVEKLQYKEILTPKWRIAEPDFQCDTKNNGAVKNPSQDSDVEDLSEDAVVARHEKCEYEEKKKFLSYLKLPIGHHRRSHKRTDSLAESSGANTPDPLSPHPVDHHENTNSPLTSPPATPLPPNTDDTSNSLPSVSMMRRRTISQSKLVKDREVTREENNTPENIEVPPYEPRIFPLDDETYDRMLQNMPVNHQFKTNIRAQDSNDYSLSYLDEKVLSPGSESTESAIGEEDPNDPEWMDVERSRDRHKR